jgi:hypothetical protein
VFKAALRLLPVVVLLFLSLSSQSVAGYGDTVAGYPAYKERAALVLTNACRMAPAGFRDKYVGNYTILLPQNYPAVRPLYWNLQLNKSSRAYAVDIANNCGLQATHMSCDGKTTFDQRIRSYYIPPGWIGENAATGYADPLQTIGQWLMDGNPPAVDKSGSDGHRKNIMDTNFREVGVGYAHGTKQWYDFWVEDFGAGTTAFKNKIAGAAHFFFKQDSVTFWANFYDSAGLAPRETSLYVNGQKYGMTLHLGTAARGTYQAKLAAGTACRNYYVSFTDANGSAFRYPENGVLVTNGEGGCTTEYLPNSAVSSQRNYLNTIDQKKMQIVVKDRHVRFFLPGQPGCLVDLNGKVLQTNRRLGAQWVAVPQIDK